MVFQQKYRNCYSSNGQTYCSVHSMLAWKRLFSLLGGAEAHSRRARRVLLLITRDVRRKDILGTLDNTFYVPIYLLRILRDYLWNHFLLYETLEGQRRMKVTAGLAKGSILGSDLWNASHDSLLKFDMPEEWRMVDYADGVASRLGILMRQVSGWMTAHGFNLAPEKTEVVILVNKVIPTLRPISFSGSIIESKPAVRYLGLIFDSKMRFLAKSKHKRTRLLLEFRR